MSTCPNGHQSVAEDWCEVCGHRMMAAAGASSPPGQGAPYGGAPLGGAAAGRPERCPQCHTPRESPGPFCEECRFNFTTSAATTYLPPQQPPGQGPGYGYPQHSPFPQPGGHPYPDAQPQYPSPPPPTQVSAPPAESGDWLLPPPSNPPPPPPAPPSGPDPRSGGYGVPGSAQPGGWQVTIATDRDYFAAMMHRSGPEAAALHIPAYAPEQQLALTGRQITIGRRRHSTGQSPDIDLGQQPEDPGVSHQHAILVQQPDGSWAVVDQDSTNGTTVNGSEEPIQPFVPVPLTDGDRVHVGAWTTLTLRRT